MQKITKTTNTVYDVIVIGGGASGMLAAGRAAELGKRVLLIEKNKRLGQKLAISGGGRCNITNAEEDEKKLLSKYGKAEPFLHSAFSQFGMQSTFDFFEKLGIPLKIEANKRAFPVSEKATDVVQGLRDYMDKGKVEILSNKTVEKIHVKSGMILSIVANGAEFTAKSYILATGGVSHPETGSTGDGFNWLATLGHEVLQPTPTIVPLSVKDAWVRKLPGVTLPDAKITFYSKSDSREGALPVKRFSRTGNILLTHFGLSGPTILNAAGMVADLLYEATVTAVIDTKPALDIGAFDAELVALFDVNKNKSLKNIFKEIAPSGTAETLIEMLSLDPDSKVHSIRKEDRRKIIDLLKGLPITINGLMGMDRAVVADGGVPLTEIDMKTMRSLKCSNLYVTGDLLDISRPSGGYSLQLCWTTGYIAGSSAG